MVVDGHMVAPGMVMKLALASGRSRNALNPNKPVVTVPPGMNLLHVHVLPFLHTVLLNL